MKRILALILALMMVVGLAACGGGNDAPSGGETPAGGAETPAGGAETPAGGGEETASTELNIYMWQQYISERWSPTLRRPTTAPSTSPT